MKWFIFTLLIVTATQPSFAAAIKKSADKNTQVTAQTQSADYINNLLQLAKNGDTAKLEELKKLADQGNPYAQGNLARIYTNGWGASKDYTAAMSWAQKAADQGNRDGMNVIGVLLFNGLGVTKDQTEGLKWIRKAAELGAVKAQVNLAIAYRTGNGIAQDDAQAVQWCTKAVEQGGDPDAQTTLGDIYHDGKGVAQDDVLAAQWYHKAAAQGNANAQNRLGFIYTNGRGVAKDDIQAAQWYRKASDQGDQDGQSNLGLMYARGTGVPRDDAMAMLLYRKAAAQGNAQAQQNIAYMESQNRGKAQNISPNPSVAPEQINAPIPIAGNIGHYKSPFAAAGTIAAWAKQRSAESDNGSDIAGAIGGSAGQQVANKALDFVPFGLGGMIGRNAGESAARSATSQTTEAPLPTADEIAATSNLSFASADELSLYMYARHSRNPEYQRVLELTMKIYPEMQTSYTAAIEKAAQSKIRTADASRNAESKKPAIAQRLEALKKLKNDGLISEKEYQAKRKKMIDEL